MTVCLWASPDTIYERVKQSSHRPLLNLPDPRARITELLAERQSVYKQADLLISTELRNVKEVAHQIDESVARDYIVRGLTYAGQNS